jgi:tRNA threonylcarbamoyladenosine biosynthesis protein TsaE
MQEKVFILNSAEQTESLACSIAKHLNGGECIELVSDLGGGKTTFTRGLVRGLGSTDIVSSPTFTIGKQYKAGDLTCYHYDFYRLQDPGLVAEELTEALEDERGIIVVEWAESVARVLPDNRIVIMIDRVAHDSETRKCIVKYGVEYAELMEQVAV